MARVYDLNVKIIGKGRGSIVKALDSVVQQLGCGSMGSPIGSLGTRARGEFELKFLPGGAPPELKLKPDEPEETLEQALVESGQKDSEPPAKNRPAPPPKRAAAK